MPASPVPSEHPTGPSEDRGPAAEPGTAPGAGEPVPDPADPPQPANRAARRGGRRHPAADDPGRGGSGRRSGPAHPGAQGRRVNPIRRTG